MTLSEPISQTPEPSAAAGFVPSRTEDPIARQLLRPMFDRNRESLILAGFDAFGRLVRLDRIDGDSAGRCVIPPRCWRGFLGGGIVAVVMAHNHPSGIAWPSEADIRATHDTALFLRTTDIDLVDHLIFVEHGHFSFRTGEML